MIARLRFGVSFGIGFILRFATAVVGRNGLWAVLPAGGPGAVAVQNDGDEGDGDQAEGDGQGAARTPCKEEVVRENRVILILKRVLFL